MIKAARGNDSQQAEPGEEQSASSLRGKTPLVMGTEHVYQKQRLGPPFPAAERCVLQFWITPETRQPLLQRKASLPLVGILCGRKHWGRSVRKEGWHTVSSTSFPEAGKPCPGYGFPRAAGPGVSRLPKPMLLYPPFSPLLINISSLNPFA